MLSKESEQFLSNLRAYLLTSGKKESEILEIVDELESHLQEAEENGKSVQDIVGQSPAAYMESIRDEMKTDVRSAIGAGLATVFGAISIMIMPEVVQGELEYSLFKLMSIFIVFIAFTIGLVAVARKLSHSNASDKKSILTLIGWMLTPMILFVGLFFADDFIETPIISLTGTPVYIIGTIALISLISLSVWSKTWVIPLVVAVLAGPELIQRFGRLSDETTLTISMVFYVLAFIGMIVYVFINGKNRD